VQYARFSFSAANALHRKETTRHAHDNAAGVSTMTATVDEHTTATHLTAVTSSSPHLWHSRPHDCDSSDDHTRTQRQATPT
jgi:hypothetical protein